ncbi:MAG: TonB-dependent receptor family protein [Woeseia sp.]
MQLQNTRKGLSATLLLILTAITAHAGETETAPDTGDDQDGLDNVTIIGRQSDAAEVPGSAHVIDHEDLQAFMQSDVMRVLRTVPGVYVQEEEGFGLRPNIGIRGSGLDRSSRIALLEDGILIAPAPYAAPSAYYFPTQRRMHALEVLKGPAAIGIGPRTTGGAINLISTPIPEAKGGILDLRIGEHATSDAHLNFGDHGRRFSWLVETVQSESDGFKHIDGNPGADTGYSLQDYVFKARLDSDPASARYQSLRLKAGYTTQRADETYLGLTDDDFILDPNRRYAASAGDVFDSAHEQLQLSYLIDPGQSWRMVVTAYRNDFSRNWFKLQSVMGTGIAGVLADTSAYAAEFEYLKGADSPDDAIVKRNNNRDYFSRGIQAELEWDFQLGDTAFGLTAGVRLHEDQEDRFQDEDGYRMQDERLILTSDGAPGSSTNRISSADVTAFFVDTEILGGNWLLTPGVRVEDIRMKRVDFSTADPARTAGPGRIRENSVTVAIPGLGAFYFLSNEWRLLAGIHKGFNPPAPGSSAAEEESVNIELGARYDSGRASFETIYFLNDYDNLVGTVTASTGGSGEIGDQFDGGAVTVQGLELAADTSFGGLAEGRLEMPVSLQYTWTTEAEFRSAFRSSFDPWGDVRIGDELPYIPEHQLRAASGLRGQDWAVNLSASFAGRMRSRAGQGAFIPAETIDAHLVWDLLASWQLTPSIRSYFQVENLLDQTYIAARRPAGARPGLGRTAYLGVTLTL